MTLFSRIKNFLQAHLWATHLPVQASLEALHTKVAQQQLQTQLLLDQLVLQLATQLRQPLPPMQSTPVIITTNDMVVTPNYHDFFRPEDVFLVSFLRSGNTWMRVILLALLYPPDTVQGLFEVNHYFPDLHRIIFKHDRYAQPRIVKGHLPYCYRHAHDDPRFYHQFIYMIRHPYNVLQSFYDFERIRQPNGYLKMRPFIERVVTNTYDYGNWGQHVLSWQYAAKTANALFIRYEDLQKDTLATIFKVATFLGKSISQAQAQYIQQTASQDNMREMDKRSPLKPGYDFVRKGAERHTPEPLTDDLKALIYTYNKAQMDDWGYLPDGTTADDYPVKATYAQPTQGAN